MSIRHFRMHSEIASHRVIGSRWTSGVALAVVGLVSFAGGCFEPRQAPPPCLTCPTPAPFKEPIIPEFVRDNIEVALERPTIDPNYRDSLTDGFVYIPDATAEAAALPGFFVGWNKPREVQFMLNLLESQSGATSGQTVDMLFTLYQDTGQLPGTNEARYEVNYEFTLTRTVVDSLQTPPIFEVEERYCGRAFWDLEGGDRNFWTLRQWEDLEPLPNPTRPCDETLGVLRATSGQGN